MCSSIARVLLFDRSRYVESSIGDRPMVEDRLVRLVRPTVEVGVLRGLQFALKVASLRLFRCPTSAVNSSEFKYATQGFLLF